MKKSLLLIFTLVLCIPAKLFSQESEVSTTETIVSSVLHITVNYSVYLPPSYNLEITREYPVLYLLHGYFGNHTDWVNNGMQTTLDSVTSNGNAYEMIVIMPDGMDAFYCNNYDNRLLLYEDFMVNELIPAVEAKYRIISSKGTRSIAGLSMGGYGATYHGFKYNDMYSSVYCMSGAVLMGGAEPNLQNLVNTISTEELQNLPAYTMEIGTSDFLYSNNQAWHSFLLAKGIPHYYIERPGTHEWAFWTICLPKAVRFASKNFDFGGNNLALNRSVTASSTDSATHAANYAVDGDTTTRWASEYSVPQDIYVDLGSLYNANSVVLKWDTSYAFSYEIQISSDLDSWATVYTEMDGDGTKDSVGFTPSKARYVRMFGITSANSFGCSLKEFEVYATSIAATVPEDVTSSSPEDVVIVYPNPASEWAIVKVGSAIEVKLYTITGVEIDRKPVENSAASFYIGNLPQGVYLFVIEQANRKVVKSVIVQ